MPAMHRMADTPQVHAMVTNQENGALSSKLGDSTTFMANRLVMAVMSAMEAVREVSIRSRRIN